MTDSPAPRKRRTVFATAGLTASAAVIAASLSMAQDPAEQERSTGAAIEEQVDDQSE